MQSLLVGNSSLPMISLEREAASALLTWLAPKDDVAGEFDAIVGFGHFDLRIVDHCAHLFRSCTVRHMVFTGGIGAGTADLGHPEADAFVAHAVRQHPDIPRERIVVENTSTNTADNIRFTCALIARERPEVRLQRVILVANPSRQRRVVQTWRLMMAESKSCSSPPPTTLDEELRLFAARKQDLIAQMIGEVERLVAYPSRGWIWPLDVPDSVRAAANALAAIAPPRS